MSEDYETGWMTEMDVKQLLFQLGHFYSPEALEIDLVTEDDLPSLEVDHPIVQAAVRSYQTWFKPDLDQLTLRSEQFGGHRREAIADGEVGPNTEELLTMPRCGMADFPHPTAACAESRWPDSCRHEITTSYRMNLSGLTADRLASLWQEADGHWQAVLDIAFQFQPEKYPNTRIYAFAQRLGGSVLADQYLAQNNCQVRLQGRFDTRTWSEALFVTTTTHEHGHALGCNHLKDPASTMYPSIHQQSLARRGAPNASDVQAMLALGYRRRATTPPPPPPPPDQSTTVVFQNNVLAGTYRLVQA